ncbi:GNAT family N-acetyltransferase, partial [Candidatus Woesearchaeota archaeon]|nr:GNAT family N-acetyltransferase [Candidatus Woesearchaeota archaeon]
MGGYPEDYRSEFRTNDGLKVVLRPIEPDDFDLENEMFSYFSKETQRLRFFTYLNEVTPEMIKRYTDVDHDVEVGIMGEIDEGGKKRMVGVVRLISERGRDDGEFAIVVADPWQGRGIGSRFMDYIIAIAQKRGLHKIYTFILPDNFRMKAMLMRRGFALKDRGDHIFATKDI